MRSGRSEVTTRVNPDLAASFFEDLRLLRWKSIGIHDPGDILLSDVGDRLAALVAAPANASGLSANLVAIVSNSKLG